jgi:Helix-turn-helix domain
MTLRPSEIADRWGVSAEFVRALIREGILATCSEGHPRAARPSYRVSLAEVERYERERQRLRKGAEARKARARRRRA